MERAGAPFHPYKFQPTPLMRGATHDNVLGVLVQAVSTHAPHARGDDGVRDLGEVVVVSTHAPHARGDAQYIMGFAEMDSFQPTPLMRGATFSFAACFSE